MIEIDNIKLYDVQEVAQMLNLTPTTVRKLIKEDKLKAKKIGRPYMIAEDALKEYVQVSR